MRSDRTDSEAATHVQDRGIHDLAGRRAEILAGTIYLMAGFFVLVYFRFRFHWFSGSWFYDHYEIASLLGGVLLLVSSFRVYARRRFADWTALGGALLIWPYFKMAEFNGFTFSSWLTFNLPDDSPETKEAILIASLTISAIGSLIAATSFAALRVMPKTWSLRNLPIRSRAWPGFAVASLLFVTWYLVSVSRYQIPIYDLHDNPPTLSVLHVVKNGLQFHESSIAFYRSGEFYSRHDDRRLFQYRFPRTVARGVLTTADWQLLHRLADSPPDFLGTQASSYSPPRSWNADRWYVLVERRVGRKQINMEMSSVPSDIQSLFTDAQQLPPEKTWNGVAKDVCLGFCYDPTY